MEIAVPAPVDEQDTRAVQRINGEQLRLHEIPLDRSSMNPDRELATLRSLIRLYQTRRPSLVHHITIKPVIYGTLAARLTGVPAVVNAISGLGYMFLGGPVRHTFAATAYRVALRHPRQVAIFQNTADRDLLCAAVPRLIAQHVLIPGSGVDLSRFVVSPKTGDWPLVVFPARMLRDKGVLEFVDAAVELQRAGVRARFALVGALDQDNPSSISRKEMEQWMEDGAIEWWGHRTDMETVLASASVVCLPSYREGMPLSLLEAAAAGCPTVTTDVPGCRDAVEDGVTGLIVPPRDVRSLSRALRSLIENPDLRIRMGTAGRKRAEAQFDVRTVVAKTLKVYDELL